MNRKRALLIRDVLGRVRATWADIRIEAGGRASRDRPHRTIAELEALYAIPPAKRPMSR